MALRAKRIVTGHACVCPPGEEGCNTVHGTLCFDRVPSWRDTAHGTLCFDTPGEEGCDRPSMRVPSWRGGMWQPPPPPWRGGQ